jgi:TonB family protein
MLAINPMADPYRVKLPPALEQTHQAFAATVRVCVSAAGSVTDVNVVRPAGPAIDSQIPAVLAKWRYRPLIEGGNAVPFCYLLDYEITGR